MQYLINNGGFLMSLKRVHPKYERITSNWGNMSLRIEMGKRIDDWLSVFENDNKGILLKLLSSFFYYDEEHVKKKAKSLYEAFIDQFEGNPSDIIYTKIVEHSKILPLMQQ